MITSSRKSPPTTEQEAPSPPMELRPVAVFNGDAMTNLADLEYRLDPATPYEVLPVVDPGTDEHTTVEILDPKVLAVRQIGEDGVAHTIILSPAQLVHFILKTRAYIGFPNGVPALLSEGLAA